MTMTIDRFEGDYAVLEIREETGEVLYKNLPASWLPDDAAEGDVLVKTAEGYAIDTLETEKRRAAAAEKLSGLQG
ncbi:MAG: DUF3006 domain-containing protein [Oscillospiraceae bacterium]|nr:DUF3006 domain-containing protein [Oscillospiraceae bacterium]MBQ5340173.1 DUF3006 domain-containing protein [Oscillospiraceae bacterium]